MEKKAELWGHRYPCLRKLLMKLKIAILIIALGFPGVLATASGLQQIRVSGTITDASSGELMPGVNIQVKGTSIGAITDANGKYSLNVPGQASVLSFSFIGYSSKEMTVGDKTVLDITLEPELSTLEEVVVIGYGTQKKVNVIGSITTITNEEINSAPVSMISNALAGRMAGVIVQQETGEPGADAANILIRGQATLGYKSPLIVVDGVAGRDMNSLSSADIESISILKDASAAIYGARAANGVILITTKRGTKGTPTVTYDFYQGMLSPVKLLDMADAATYAEMIREMQSYREVSENNMMFSTEDIEKYKSGRYPWTHPDVNAFDESLRAYSTTRNHSLAVSGGTDAVTYYGSFGSKFDDGIYKKSASSYHRYNLKANIDAKINQYLTIGLDLTGSQEKSMFPVTGQEHVWNNIRTSRPTDPVFFPNGWPAVGISFGRNPAIMSGFDPGFDDNKTYRLNSILSASLKVPFVEGLTVSSYYAYDKYFRVRKEFQNVFTLYSFDKQAYLNAGNTGIEDGSDFLLANYPKGEVPEPQLEDGYSESDSKVFNLKVNYDKSFSGGHNFSAFIAMESSDYLSKGISAFRRYFISDQLPYLFAGSTTEWSNDGGVSIDARLNYFGRLMYNFRETYLLQFSLRRDGSLRFSKESGRWGTFPSVLAGWRISNENFWRNNVKFIDYLKLKASYGQLGNDRVDAFQYLTSYEFDDGNVFGPLIYAAGLSQSSTANPNITWEVANIYNTGFESTILKKITLNTDFFYQRRSDILVQRDASVPNFTGIELPDENYGIVDSKGFEIELGFNDMKNNFSYGFSGNVSFSRNKIIEFDEPARNVDWQVRTGHPQGALLMYRAIGVFRDEAHLASLPHVAEAEPGDIILEDYDKSGEINSEDQILFDKTDVPELFYGLNFNVSYKNWSLTGLIQGAGTTLRYIDNRTTGSLANYYAFEAEDRWTVNNKDASRPRAKEREEEYWVSTYQSDYNYAKGGYGRLKNLQLSYSIPSSLLEKVMMKDAKIYFSGQNILLIYSQNKILDPETASIETYPIMKTFILGVKVAF